MNEFYRSVLRNSAIETAERVLGFMPGFISTKDDGAFEISMIRQASLTCFIEDSRNMDASILREAMKRIMKEGIL